MADQPVSATGSRKSNPWLRRLAWGFGGLVVLLLALYFLGTSAAFLKGFILPRVAKAANAEITVADASISPFSQVTLKNLTIKTTGSEPLATIGEVRLRYSLMDILGGNLHVEEVTIVSPTVKVSVNADGTSNLDPFTKRPASAGAAKPAAPAKAGKPLALDVRSVQITGANLRYVTAHTNGTRDDYALSNVGLTLTGLKNGQTAKLTLEAGLAAQLNPPGGTNGSAQAKLNGSFEVGLTADAGLASAKGNLHLGVDQTTGALAQAAGLGADLDCDLTPTDLKGLVLRFQKGATKLGEIRANGPFDMAKLEGRIVLAIPGIDKQLLNLAAEGQGMDFGMTVIQSTNTIVLAQGGMQITAGGEVGVKAMQIARTGQTTPTLDFRASYDTTVDRTRTNALVRALNLNAIQEGVTIMHADLAAPITVSWGPGAGVAGESSLNLALNQLDLAKWKPILGKVLPAGVINAQLKAVAQQGGKQIALDFSGTANQLTLAPPAQPADATNPGMPTTLSANAAAKLAIDLTAGAKLPAVKGTAHFGMDKADGWLAQAAGVSADLGCDVVPTRLNLVSLKLARNGTSLGEVRASGPYDLAKTEGRVVVEIPALDRQLLNLATAGKDIDFGTTVIRSTNTIELTSGGMVIRAGGQVNVDKLQMITAKETTPTVDLKAGYDVSMDRGKKVATLSEVLLTLVPTARATNQIQMTGKFDTSQTNGLQGELKLNADSLDFTTYYDLFTGGPKPAATKPAGGVAGKQPAPGATNPQPAATLPEPLAMHLPIGNLTVTANLRRVYLHEVEVADFQAGTRVTSSTVAVTPFKFSLNGAPVDAGANVDLSLPGYKYDLTFNASAIPLPPLISTFQPERKGQISGTLTAQARMSGAGITGPSLQTNLMGQFYCGTTNLNLAVENVQNKMLRTVVEVVVAVPDLIKNPSATGMALVSQWMGKTNNAVPGDLGHSIINSIVLRGNAGAGKVVLEQATVSGPTFLAEAPTTISLAPVLTNSALNTPVSISLSRDVAQKIRFTPPNTASNATYVKLPDFFTMKGTVGAPQKDLNYLALAKGTAQGVAPGIGGKAGSVISSLLGSGGTNSASSTNTQSGGLLQGLGGLLNRPAGTNAPGVSTNASPGSGLLNSIFGPKK